MTRHISEDRLLELSLGLLEAEPESGTRLHLEACTECRARMQEVDRFLREIRDAAPEVQGTAPLFPSRMRDQYRWLRVAAMLAVGFSLGFLASESMRSPATSIVRQQIIPSPPEWSTTRFVSCEEIDLSWSTP